MEEGYWVYLNPSVRMVGFLPEIYFLIPLNDLEPNLFSLDPFPTVTRCR